MKTGSWKRGLCATGMAAVVGVGALYGVGPAVAGAASSPVVVGKNVPSSAMSTRIGLTAKTVTIGNIATHSGNLFTGAAIGTEAYADYVNSTGGINGRKIVVTVQDTKLKGTLNAALTASAMKKDFSLVGGFSVVATSGGQILAKNPGMPDVQVTVTPVNNTLPNLVSPVPLGGGWQEGSLLYFKKVAPKGAPLKAGAMVANEASSVAAWQGQEATMKHLGYKVTYENTFTVLSNYTTFVTDVIAMKNAGVQMLFIEQNPPMYATQLIKAMNAQNYHPMVVLGASTYSDTLIPTSGGAAATTGMYLEQNLALYLGTDKKAIPAVTTFLKWVKKATASFKPDLFAMYGWLSAELFSQALKNAGKNPSRGSLLKALGKVTKFTGGNLTAPTNPAAKTVSNCYLIGQIKKGKWLRKTDPPINSATNGYRCTDSYYVPPGTKY